MARNIIRLPEVKRRTGKSGSSIYADIALGLFPAQIPLGGRAVGWDEASVDAWIEARVAEAKNHASMHVNKAPGEIGMSPEDLQPFIDSGELPTYKLGRHQLIKKSALAEFQKKQTAGMRGGS